MISLVKKRTFFFLLLTFFGLVFIGPLNAHSENKAKQDSKSRIHPTLDNASPTKVYIPKDLNDCFVELEKMLSPELLKEMKSGKEEHMIIYHMSLGIWMRNNWGFWGGSRLSRYFNSIGIRHPDDMSGIIFTSFWRHLNNKPIDLSEQVKYYQDYWKKLEKEQKAEEEKEKRPLKQ